MQDYYERFCNRRDNPTLNLIEVELRRLMFQGYMLDKDQPGSFSMNPSSYGVTNLLIKGNTLKSNQIAVG
jgi:hypothetical protein